MILRLDPVTIEGLENGEGVLAYWNDRLVAVFVRLGRGHEADEGAWFLEKGFGPLDGPQPPAFANLDQVRGWVSARLS
jgi:hypothetical protein